jgi:predicted transcriptional regulator
MLGQMSDLLADLPPINPPAPVASKPNLNPVAVLFALASPVRWPIMKMLADGKSMSISEVARALGRDVDAIGKHLLVMEKAGVLEGFAGEDRRQSIYRIPAQYRRAPGVVDYGFCVVDLGKG